MTRSTMLRWFAAGALLAGMLAGAAPAHAGSDNTGTLGWLVGEELAQLDGQWPPAVSYAADGSRIQMSGAGDFTIGDGTPSVSGGGDYRAYGPDGVLVAEGEWALTRLGGYVDYGFDPAFGESLRGGQLRAEVALDGLGVGRIWITCLAPDAPPSARGGVRVDVGALHFDEEDPHSPAVFVRS